MVVECPPTNQEALYKAVSTAHSQARRHRPIVSTLRRWMPKDQKFKDILDKHRARVSKGGSDMSLIFRIHVVEECWQIVL